MKVLAFDFGASGGKAFVYTLEDQKLTANEVHRFDNEPVLVNGSFHWDILRLFHEIKNGILKCKQEGYDIDAIGIDTWGVDYGLLDKNGSLLGNPYHYRDMRTSKVNLSESEKREIFASTGIQFAPINTLFQFICEVEGERYKAADTALFIPDLFNYFLTGNKKTEYTIASTSQMLNAKKREFDEELLKKFGIENKFAPIVMPGEIVGYLSDDICEELSVKKVPVIAVASHDTASAVVCAPMEDAKKSVYISCGTWLLLGSETDEPIITDKSFEYNYTNEGGAFGKYRFLHNIMGLWIQQETKREWKRQGIEVGYQQMEDEASVSEAMKCFINPNYESFSPPGNMPKRIQEFAQKTNQPVPEGCGEITRCIMESLALECARSIREMSQMLSEKPTTINMVGGGIKNAILCQFVANATNMRVVAGPVEATSIGNALLQFYALGKISTLDEARAIVSKSFEPKVYEPRDVDVWEEANKRFEKICKMI